LNCPLSFGLEVPQGWYVQENTPTGSESLVITSFDPASPPHKLEWDSQTVSIEIIPISPEFAPTSLDAWVENARQTAISSQLELFNEERFLLGQDTPAIRLTLVSGSGGVIDQVLTILNHHNLEILVQGNFELARSVLSSIYSIPALDAVRTFAGEDYEVAVVPEKAQALLTRYDARSQHYELRAEMKGSA
jgi:hypothetical protein